MSMSPRATAQQLEKDFADKATDATARTLSFFNDGRTAGSSFFKTNNEQVKVEKVEVQPAIGIHPVTYSVVYAIFAVQITKTVSPQLAIELFNQLSAQAEQPTAEEEHAASPTNH